MLQRIKNMKIGAKLYLMVSIALAGMILIGVMSILQMGRIERSSMQIAEEWLPSLTSSNSMRTALSNVRLNELGYVTAATPEVAQSSQGYVTKEISGMDQKISAYTAYIYDAEEQRLYEALQSAWSSYKQIDSQVMRLAGEGKTEEAQALLDGDGAAVYNEVSSALTDLLALNEKGSGVSYNEGARTYTSAIVSQILTMVVVVAIGIIFSFMIIKCIRQPVLEIADAAVEMAKGKLDVAICYQSKDELGVLADQFREVVRKIGAIFDDENKFLAKMADGDLTVDSICEHEYIGDFHQVLVSFRTIAERMNAAMTQISGSSDQVSSSADQVSSGAQALSQGATEQASSIEELAATIAEISEQIQENASNANYANEKVNAVGDEMNLSNTKMQDMIQAMSEISNSSHEIGKIIKTIEDIAFQTNILALNAAVEAARAGSAGKGFAVVADEVRNLASKSAEASKNTAALIENSIRAVENGTQIADETAQSLLHAVDGAKEVTVLVDKISEASAVQSASIAQITQGIDQISSVIQTNSATAQESAAASEELSSQAQLMKGQVSKFRLKEERPY